jgi:hypothetical protein
LNRISHKNKTTDWNFYFVVDEKKQNYLVNPYQK